ncbi:hypothetical protein ACRS42_26430 [Bacillus thuringiensis]|uniref:hypothetical protein n=1 Tax=Bacillus cereus group TaxID=86661 RepID=UPI00345C25B9|nr:hypothetical protein [Bacillus cereus]
MIAASKSFLITSFPSSQDGQYVSNRIRHKAILDFIKQQYNILTNSDENYIHEVHDPQVAEITAKTAKRLGLQPKKLGLFMKQQFKWMLLDKL